MIRLTNKVWVKRWRTTVAQCLRHRTDHQQYSTKQSYDVTRHGGREIQNPALEWAANLLPRSVIKWRADEVKEKVKEGLLYVNPSQAVISRWQLCGFIHFSLIKKR